MKINQYVDLSMVPIHFKTCLYFLFIISLLVILIFIHIEYMMKKMHDDIYYITKITKSFVCFSDIAGCIYDVRRKKYEFISETFEKTFELNEQLMKKENKCIYYYLPEEVRDGIMKQYLSSENVFSLKYDFEYTKPFSKVKCWLVLRVYPIMKKGKTIKYVFIAIDITKEKQNQQLLEKALSDLQTVNEAKKEFVSHLSHELKTPISSIIGLNKIASASLNDPDKLNSCMNKIDTTSRRLLEIINNILDITKMDSKGLVLHNEIFNLNSAMATFASIMKEQADMNSRSFSYDMRDIRDDYLIGDSLRLTQILGNCISNSIQFTYHGGSIHLEITETERNENTAYFCFIVSDNGKGMSEEFLKRIFEPFEQEDYSISAHTGGTGLGLSITEKLVKLMGGKIQITSKLNMGTTITINLCFPVSDLSIEVEAKSDNHQSNGEYERKRVLLIDDNEINREVTTELLSYADFYVDTAGDGYEALQLFTASPKGYYDIILIDLFLPKIDGYRTAELIRDSSHPDAKTINIASFSADQFNTGYTETDSVFNYHLMKPIDTGLLKALLQ